MTTLRIAVLALAALPSGGSGASTIAPESRPGGPSVEECVAALGDPDLTKHVEAMMALIAVGRPAVPALVAATRDHSDRRRLGAARTLAEIGGPGVAAPIARVVERDAVFSNRLHAAIGLSKLSTAGDREAREVLAAVVAKMAATLESADTEAADDAGRLLGSIGEPARDAIMTALAHPRPEVRIRAVGELSNLKTGVLAALTKAADDPVARVRAVALSTLAVRAIWDAPDSAAGIAVIRSKLKDPDPAVREAAASALKTATTR